MPVVEGERDARSGLFSNGTCHERYSCKYQASSQKDLPQYGPCITRHISETSCQYCAKKLVVSLHSTETETTCFSAQY
jgi:hypothetical protein